MPNRSLTLRSGYFGLRTGAGSESRFQRWWLSSFTDPGTLSQAGAETAPLAHSASQSRLRITMCRLRCCRSRVFMHLSRRLLICFVCFLVSASVVRSAAAAQAYVIADAQTGYILEEQEPRKKLQVGSLTKIATASVVLDWAERKSGDLNRVVTIPQEVFSTRPLCNPTTSLPTRWRTK